MRLVIKMVVNRLSSLLNRHLLPMAFLVSVSIHLAAFDLVINHRKPFLVISQKNKPILVTLTQAPTPVLMEESKTIIQPKVNPQLTSQTQAQKVIKQKAKPVFAPPEKLPKVRQLVAIDKEKVSLSEISKRQIIDLDPSLPMDKKEDVSNQEVSLTHQIEAPKATIINQAIVEPKTPQTNTAIKTGVSISASYAKTNQKPEYPSQSRRLNEEGTVVLSVFVTAEGMAGAVEIKSSSGFPMLDQSAKDAVKQWHFNPATVDGIPIDESYSLRIPFKLNG